MIPNTNEMQPRIYKQSNKHKLHKKIRDKHKLREISREKHKLQEIIRDKHKLHEIRKYPQTKQIAINCRL